MQKIRLGKTGLMVTKIGFGGIPIQRVAGDVEAHRLVRTAVEMGINWFDTAAGYSCSEERIGAGIKGFDRESLYILTKSGGKTAEAIAADIERSLRRLDTEYLDVWQFHNPGSDAWREVQENGAMDMLLEMRQKGIVRHIGVSAHGRDALLEAMDHHATEMVQYPFNFIMYEEAAPVLEKCQTNDIGFVAMKPFGGGVFPSAGPCIRFLTQYPDIVADPGFETIDEMKEVIALIETGDSLSEADRLEIRQVSSELGKRFCRRCGYCMPCPQGVPIVNLMIIESVIRRMAPRQVITEKRRQDVAALDKCNECGLCEKKCPYELPIRQSIRQAREMFEDYSAKHH